MSLHAAHAAPPHLHPWSEPSLAQPPIQSLAIFKFYFDDDRNVLRFSAPPRILKLTQPR